MKTVRNLDLAGQKVLVRVDFNVPINEQGEVTDDLRIQAVLPTLHYLIEHKARVVLCTHMGRPKGQAVEKYSLAPLATYLGTVLDMPVAFVPDCIGPEVASAVADLADGQVLLLENLRFHAGEEKNDPEFSRQLATGIDIYVNDAFAVSHRAHASVVGVTAHVQECAAGFLLAREIEYFHRCVETPQRPLVAIIGGAKVSGKLEALHTMLDRVDKMILGGAMANTFLKSQGYDVGASKVEEELLDAATDLLRKAGEKKVKVYLPVDVIAADRFSPDAICKQVTVQDIPEQWLALDIGPASVICFNEVLAEARTIVWNGPVGAFEMDAFSRGTLALAHTIAASHALSVVGGGDSNAAVKMSGEAENFSYMSTGGGAFLMLMEGKELPGVKALD